jgi:predicted alpha/beta-hydrolase family hydrolase
MSEFQTNHSVAEPFQDDSVSPAVRGFLHTPATSNGDGLVLSHGAGSNANALLLIALAETFAAEGYFVLRCNLPYRQTRSYGPPGPGDAERDREGLKNAVAALRRIARGSIFLGGHSYGGRQSTMLCAEEAELVKGLLLMSYPLHPPRKPEQKRVQHLPKLQTPSLFVSGTRDPFGSIAEMEDALHLIPAPTKLVPVEGAGHDLGFTNKGSHRELPSEIWAVFREFFLT